MCLRGCRSRRGTRRRRLTAARRNGAMIWAQPRPDEVAAAAHPNGRCCCCCWRRPPAAPARRLAAPQLPSSPRSPLPSWSPPAAATNKIPRVPFAPPPCVQGRALRQRPAQPRFLSGSSMMSSLTFQSSYFPSCHQKAEQEWSMVSAEPQALHGICGHAAPPEALSRTGRYRLMMNGTFFSLSSFAAIWWGEKGAAVRRSRRGRARAPHVSAAPTQKARRLARGAKGVGVRAPRGGPSSSRLARP